MATTAKRPEPSAASAVRTVLANSELLQAIVAHGSTLQSAASLMLATAKLLDTDGRADSLLGVCRALPEIALKRRPEWRHDREAMTLACTKQATLLEIAADFLRDDETVVAAAMRANSPSDEALQFASERLRGDEAIVTIAVTRNGLNLHHASPAMRAKRSVVLCAVTEWGLALEHASDELRDDREIVLRACGPNTCEDHYDDDGPLKFASERLRNDREIALLALPNHALSLEFLSDELRNDEEIVRAAADDMPYVAMRHCNERFRDDPDWVAEMLNHEITQKSDSHAEIYELISERLLDDEPFTRQIMADFGDGRLLQYCSERLRSQRPMALLALSYEIDEAAVFASLSPALQDDVSIALVAVSRVPRSLRHASERLRAERFFCMVAIKSYPRGSPLSYIRFGRHPLEFMSDSLRNDREIVLESVKKEGLALQHASAQLKASLTVCAAAVAHNGYALRFCGPAQRDDPAIVHAAVRQNVRALEHASERLRGDPETVELAIGLAGTDWRAKVLPYTTPAMRRLAEVLGR